MKLFKEVLRENLKMILFYVLIGIAINFLDLYAVTYYQKILDAYQFHMLTIAPLLIYGVLLIVSTILGYIENYPEQQVKNKLYLDFKLAALRKMKTIDYLKYQELGTGLLTQRVEDGATASTSVMIDFYLKIARWLLPTAAFSLFFIYNVEKKLVLFVLLGYVVVILISNLILKKLYALKEKILVNQETLNRHLVRGFMELVVFRTNKKYDTEIQITKDGIKNITDAKTKIKLVHEMFFSIFSLIVNVLKVLVLGYAVIHSNLTVGAIVTVLSLLGKAYEPIAIFNVEYVDYKLNKVTVKRYLSLLDEKDDEALLEGKRTSSLRGDLLLENVSFSYGKRDVIENLNLKIPQSSSVALVGQTGSGKSTTLRENLVFDKQVDDEKIIEVLRLVHLEKFYEKLELGLDTELGEKGVKMSGGERQRVALARLFFEDSSIVILDEATSAMDNLTEKAVMKNILERLHDKTLIIIAHRLETIKDVDEIYCLNDGKIVESGNYESLLREQGYFAKLYKVAK